MCARVWEWDGAGAGEQERAQWARVYAGGEAQVAGGGLSAGEVAERVRGSGSPQVWRWAACTGSGGAVVGVGELRRQPFDASVGALRLYVEPGARRQGLGTWLRAAALERARSEGMERTQSTVVAGPQGEDFARTSPWLRTVLALELHQQVLDEPTLARCRSLASSPRPGYRPAHWVGPAPDALAASFGRVMGHLLEAPGAGLRGAGPWGAQQVRAWERRMGEDGARLVVGAVLDRTSDGVVAATASTVTRAQVALQHDTAVLPQHRRKGLAIRVKAAQALRIHEYFPHVRVLSVMVEPAHAAMVALNRSLGYARVGERLLVEEDLRRG
ncbi:GNAT family N-acetyltransferase [Nocardiopsis salina]|uniref:GNAT family N-acetyltransferase n=1 Tax=Nocardiopsis salina TaxID=245836 RepID=UPI00036239FB|nr:GNAT family N-acetyltransferase [Nocardiopsis salina]